jgi:hypothetical protein
VSDAPAEGGACATGSATTAAFMAACSGSCTSSLQFTSTVGPGDPQYPGCAFDGPTLLHIAGLVDSAISTVTLHFDVDGYHGADTYTLAGSAGGTLNVDHIPTSCNPPDQATTTLEPDLASEPGATCTVVVTQDCIDATGAHLVVGTFTCSIPGIPPGADCTFSSGTFSFGACR